MGVGITILIICLLVFGFGLNLAGKFLQTLVFFCVLLLLFTFLTRLGQRAAGKERSRGRRGPSSRGSTGVGDVDVGRLCSNRRCGRINEHRARFCAQCGSRLP